MTHLPRRGAWLVSILLAFAFACGGGGDDQVPCESSGMQCVCGTLADEPEDVTCEASQFGTNGYCCQDAEKCTCNEARCADDPLGYCSCTASWRQDPSAVTALSCNAPVGGRCCIARLGVSGSYCYCYTADCLAGDTEVSSCSLEDAQTCVAEAMSVASCS